MTKEEFLLRALPSDPDKDASPRYILERAWEVMQPDFSRRGLFDRVVRAVAVVMTERLTNWDARAFWANSSEMKRLTSARDHVLPSVVVVSFEVLNRPVPAGTILEPMFFSWGAGSEPVRLLMLSPYDLTRIQAGELEVPQSFGTHWELVHPARPEEALAIGVGDR